MFKLSCFLNNKMLEYQLYGLFKKDEYVIYQGSLEEIYYKLLSIKEEIIVISSYFVKSRSQVLDVLVNMNHNIVIYISDSLEYGLLYNVLDNPSFFLLSVDGIKALNNIVKYMLNVRKKHEKSLEEIRRLKDKAESMTLTQEAKLILIKEKNYQEEQAHKYIIKKAMELRKTKAEIAKMIIERVLT